MYNQTDLSTVSASVTNPYEFDIGISGNTSGITGGNLSIPTTPTAYNLALSSQVSWPGYTSIAFSSAVPNFPNGSYTLTLTNGTTSPSSAINFVGDNYPSTIPQITNGTWDSGTKRLLVNGTSSYTFNFNSVTSGFASATGSFFTHANGGTGTTSGGTIYFAIYAVDGSNNPTGSPVGQASSVNVTGDATPLTSYTLGSGLLSPGSTYFAHLEFTEIVALDNVNKIYGGSVFALYGNQTQFYITAIPEPGATALLLALPIGCWAIRRRTRRA